MLGEQITDLKGKVTGQRVLDAECPTIETSVSSTGNAKGVRINEILTFVAKPSSPGVLHGRGQGVFSAESGMAAWTGEGIGRMTPSGITWRGAIFLTESTGQLAFLNNMVAIFEKNKELSPCRWRINYQLLSKSRDWQRRPTNVPGIFLLKLPSSRSRQASIAIGINPVDPSGSATKKRGVVIRSTSELDQFNGILTDQKLIELARRIDEVNPKQNEQV